MMDIVVHVCRGQKDKDLGPVYLYKELKTKVGCPVSACFNEPRLGKWPSSGVLAQNAQSWGSDP